MKERQNRGSTLRIVMRADSCNFPALAESPTSHAAGGRVCRYWDGCLALSNAHPVLPRAVRVHGLLTNHESTHERSTQCGTAASLAHGSRLRSGERSLAATSWPESSNAWPGTSGSGSCHPLLSPSGILRHTGSMYVDGCSPNNVRLLLPPSVKLAVTTR